MANHRKRHVTRHPQGCKMCKPWKWMGNSDKGCPVDRTIGRRKPRKHKGLLLLNYL